MRYFLKITATWLAFVLALTLLITTLTLLSLSKPVDNSKQWYDDCASHGGRIMQYEHTQRCVLRGLT